jgi:hypothetical protein
MIDNTYNWGLNILITPTKAKRIINIYGCNQDVRRDDVDRNKIITGIPISYIKLWENEYKGFSLDWYLKILTKNGFPCRLATEEEIDSLKNERFKEERGDDYVKSDYFTFVVQDIEYSTRVNKRYYYTFCMLRHLYYYNNSWAKNVVNHLLKDDSLNLLSLAASLPNKDNMHSVFYGKNIINPFINRLIDLGIGNANFTMSDNRLKHTNYYLDEKNPSDISIYTGSVKLYLHEMTEKDKNKKFKDIGFSDSVKKNKVVAVQDSKTNGLITHIPLDGLRQVEHASVVNKIKVLSRHPSHDVFRTMSFKDKKVLLRLGSQTVVKPGIFIEINTIPAIQNSSNKFLMKRKFDEFKVATPQWFTHYNRENNSVFDERTKTFVGLADLPYPIITKHVLGSRSTSVRIHQNLEELNAFLRSKKFNVDNYIFEKYANFSKEYRVHATQTEAFLVWRKVMKKETPEDRKHIRCNENCEWLSDSNPNFEEPISYKEMLVEAVKAVRAVGLAIGACDIRVQSNFYKKGDRMAQRQKTEFMIIEVNSAPSMAPRTEEAYKEVITDLVNKSK